MKSRFVLLLVVFLMSTAPTGCTHGNPDALWQIVHQHCVPDQRQNDNPKPCVAVNLSPDEARGSAVLKDRNGPYQFLLIATGRLSGIEDAALYAAGATNYFAEAWAARHQVEKGVGHALPRDNLSLEINSQFARTQNQMHIHIDCLRPEVREALRQRADAMTDQWTELAEPLAGHHVRVRRIHDPELTTVNPLLVVPELVGGTPFERARHSLLLAGAHFADDDDGFLVLDARAGLWPLEPGSLEDLQDHQCR